MSVLLGGTGSFVGQLLDLQVVVMMRADQLKSLAASRHALPPPLNRERVRGDMVLIRMDDNAEPQDFTYEQYAAYCTLKKVTVPAARAAAAASSSSSSVETKAPAKTAASAPVPSSASSSSDDAEAARRKKKYAKKKAAEQRKKAEKAAAAATAAPPAAAPSDAKAKKAKK